MRYLKGLVAVFLFICAVGHAADVYRCKGEHGEVSFSQTPCAGGRVDVRYEGGPGSPSTGLRSAEKAWLAARRGEKKRAKKASKRPVPSGVERREKARKQAYQCTRKRRALSALEADLRRGYKAGRGEKLHRRQRALRDYLGAFCR